MKERRRKSRTDEEEEEGDQRRKHVVLDDNIIRYEILPWVPLKSLFRFKLVCKEWCELISSDTMFKTSQTQRCSNQLLMHTTNNPKSLVCLLTSAGIQTGFPDPSLSYIPRHRGCPTVIRASTNGLLCGICGYSDTKIFLTNPITKDFVIISTPLTILKSDVLALAFELSDSRYWIVYPYVHQVDRSYKKISFMVYFSKMSEWKIINPDLKVQNVNNVTLSCCERSIYVDGKLYWLMRRAVLWFDVKEDNAGVVAAPKEGLLSRIDNGIGDYNGKLSYTNITSKDINIWVLQNKGAEFKWEKKYCLSWTKVVYDSYGLSKTSWDALKSQVRIQTDGEVTIYRAKPVPCEGGEYVLFKMNDVLYSYNMTTRKLQVIHESKCKCICFKPTSATLPQSIPK